MWTVARIDDSDYGCEERLPGEPLMVLVTIESDDGRVLQFEVADEWLTIQEIDEGDEWPVDLEEEDPKAQIAGAQTEWMEQYFRALEEFEEE